MAETVPVRCPACRREHRYTAPAYPCVCGAPVAPRLDRDGPATPVLHRVWQDDWVTVRCGSCGRRGEWPRPEVGCACGVVLRVAMAEHQGATEQAARGDGEGAGGRGAETDLGCRADLGEETDRDHGTGQGGLTSRGYETNRDCGANLGSAPGRKEADQDPETGREGATEQAATSDGEAEGGRGTETDMGDGADLGDETDLGSAPGGTATDQDPEAGRDGAAGQGRAAGSHGPGPDRRGAAAAARAARPPFLSVTIRTARDAVTATALYLRWLGYRGVRRADQRPPSGIGLAARGVVAQVDPVVRPATLRDVECLWLTAMTESADCLYFSLAGYADDARARADALGVPLFVLDLTGTPRPVNTPAETLAAGGLGHRAP